MLVGTHLPNLPKFLHKYVYLPHMRHFATLPMQNTRIQLTWAHIPAALKRGILLKMKNVHKVWKVECEINVGNKIPLPCSEMHTLVAKACIWDTFGRMVPSWQWPWFLCQYILQKVKNNPTQHLVNHPKRSPLKLQLFFKITFSQNGLCLNYYFLPDYLYKVFWHIPSDCSTPFTNSLI